MATGRVNGSGGGFVDPNPKPELKTRNHIENHSGDNPVPKPNPVDTRNPNRNPNGEPKPENHHYIAIRKIITNIL